MTNKKQTKKNILYIQGPVRRGRKRLSPEQPDEEKQREITRGRDSARKSRGNDRSGVGGRHGAGDGPVKAKRVRLDITADDQTKVKKIIADWFKKHRVTDVSINRVL